MKKIKTFEHKKVLVLGLARSGFAAAKLLHELGAIVTVNDGKPFDENKEAQELLKMGIKVICGSHPLDLLDEDFAMMVKNPGIPYENPMVAKAIAQNIPVYTEVELAYLVSESPIIGITGTNGKTTITTEIFEMFNADKKSARLAGNIGFPASEVIFDAKADDTLVMELSSFQLMGIEKFRPHIAILANLFSAHLDYHGSQEAYEAAKWNLQNNMTSEDFLILNFNQEKIRKLSNLTKATVVPFATDEKVDGAYSLDGKIYFKDEYIMDVAELSLPGAHNVENALAALTAAKLSGISNVAIKQVLTTFSGVKHRLQYLGELSNRKIYNDSKATNVLATQKALSGFDKSKTWILLGGLNRGNDLTELSADLTGIKGMIVMGETAVKFDQLGKSLNIPTFTANKVDDGLKIAFEQSDEGDNILLSPASASWDQYKTFEERGDLFIKAFDEIKEKI